MSTQPIFDDMSTRYLDRVSRSIPRSGRIPATGDTGPGGRPYIAPDIPQFRYFANFKKRLKFWNR